VLHGFRSTHRALNYRERFVERVDARIGLGMTRIAKRAKRSRESLYRSR